MQNYKLNDILKTARAAAAAASEAIVAFRHENKVQVSFKSEKDLVTNADLKAESIIIQHIRSHYPEHKFLTEESHPTYQDPKVLQGPLWIIDPIDGTTNFATGHAHVAVSIAFADAGQVLVGVVHAPFEGEIFEAVRGQGATLNGTPIQSRAVGELKLSLIATGFSAKRKSLTRTMAQVEAVLTHCRDIRRLGSASLDISWVACGRLDGYWESISPWDLAAAALVAREAGAITGSVCERPSDSSIPSDLYGKEFLVASAPLYKQLQSILNVGLD